jgi:hypothetical protein
MNEEILQNLGRMDLGNKRRLGKFFTAGGWNSWNGIYQTIYASFSNRSSLRAAIHPESHFKIAMPLTMMSVSAVLRTIAVGLTTTQQSHNRRNVVENMRRMSNKL